WTRKFKADLESTLALVWVTLPELPWHYHAWATTERILEPIGPLITLEKATVARTRPTTTKARVEIDLTKPRIKKIQVALIDNNDEFDTFNQIIEYESVPEFCYYCRKKGHSDEQCRNQYKKEEGTCSSIVVKERPTKRHTKNGEGEWIEVKKNKIARKGTQESNKKQLNLPSNAQHPQNTKQAGPKALHEESMTRDARLEEDKIE
uniref:DUF4283 domain-containing protein n=1 Tax=Nicotiana tabacum TaxID=4097 RepID=A0A1S4D1A7_TOBAC